MKGQLLHHGDRRGEVRAHWPNRRPDHRPWQNMRKPAKRRSVMGSEAEDGLEPGALKNLHPNRALPVKEQGDSRAHPVALLQDR